MTDSQCDRLDQMVTEHREAVRAVSRGLELAAMCARDDKEVRVLLEAERGLKVLSGEEEGGACACGQEECRG